MSSSNLVRIGYKKEVTYGVTPAGVKALLLVQDITYTAKKAGTQGNSISITYTTGAVAGSEVVTVNGNAIVIQISTGVSTATQVKAAFDGSAAAVALATAAITGTASDTQVSASIASLATGAGEYKTARFTSESYSGTPETTESQQIRTDRQSSGQVVTGLTVGGGHNFELAKETAIEDFMESAMFSSWDDTFTLKTRSLTIDISLKKITAVAGSFITDGLVVGDFIQLGGFTASGNNVIVMVTSVSTLELTYAGPEDMVNGTGVTTTYLRGSKLAIGITKHSLTIEKAFIDLTNKAIVYRGMLASSMQLQIAYGSLITGSFELSGNDYDLADAASEFATYEHYITDAATSQSLNGSVDMPFLATNITGSYGTDDFCIQSLDLNLSNNLTTQTCIGQAAPEGYNPGTAGIEVSLSSYLKDSNWDMLTRKLSQDPFAIGFPVKNNGGTYAFYLPAVQVSFDDPASAGANQDISMDMSGTAKVGANGESAMTIYKFVA